MKYGFAFFAFIFGIPILIGTGILVKVFLFPLLAAGKLVDTGYKVTEKTLNADNVIYNYEWFKQTHEDIQAIERKIVNSDKKVESFKEFAGDRKDWTFEDKNEYSRLDSISLGLMNQLEDVVAKYNARSKMANRNIFKDGLIPNTLEIGSNILR